MPFVTVCGATGVGVTVAKTRKAAEERLLIEADTRGWDAELGEDPLAEVLITKVLQRDFFSHLRPHSQLIYNRGLGVIWPTYEQVMDLGPAARREFDAMMKEAEEKGLLKTASNSPWQKS